MTHPDPSWDLYRTFLAVLREGSLSGAARSLGLTQPTVGRHVDALEQAVGFPLFTRSQHGLAPTPAAGELRPYAEALASTTAALLRAASGQRGAVKGVVRVSASEIMGVEVLPPILAELRERHPGLTIELVLSNAVEDLLRRDADIAVRMVEPAQAALVARRLGSVTLGMHAHRRYLDRHGAPDSLDDLARHSVIGFDRETPAIRALLRRVPGIDRGRFALRADSDLAQLAAIRAGFGIGVCQVALARRDPDLVRVLPDGFELKLGTWLAMHENLRSTPRCRAVFDALAQGLEGHVER
ncbi:LysR family transcriptional regulator [Azospirillum sp.]|uniref:LysR family transcriptional regulator n=1 Tax=Azospirillum sp. TaxID=34012 RepID=UPI002D49EEFC|nr:LysR family transcriptional regulator [Azospirillum sp.]HYD71160.1 LysR family transcriptional regulator [Azospirillum sp.]